MFRVNHRTTKKKVHVSRVNLQGYFGLSLHVINKTNRLEIVWETVALNPKP